MVSQKFGIKDTFSKSSSLPQMGLRYARKEATSTDTVDVITRSILYYCGHHSRNSYNSRILYGNCFRPAPIHIGFISQMASKGDYL